MASAQPLTAFQSPYASFAGLNATGIGGLPQYWPSNAGSDYNNSSALMPQYFQWPSFSNLHTAHGAPSYGGVPYPPFAPSAGANPYYYPFNKNEDDAGSEEKVSSKVKKSSSKYISEEDDEKSEEKKTREDSEEEYTSSKKRDKSKKKTSKKKSSKYDKSEEHEDEEEAHSDVEHEEEDEYNTIVDTKSKKSQIKVRSEYNVPHHEPSGYGMSSSGGHADHTHVHYYKNSEDKDQGCFCTIGKVGYMEPGGHGGKYGHSSGGGKGGGSKNREELGFAVGIPVTAGILALITGVAAFLLTLAFQGVGREGSMVLNELKKKSPLFNRILEVHPLDKMMAAGISGEELGEANKFEIPELPPLPATTAVTKFTGGSKFSPGSSAFAPHRSNLHMRMKRSFRLKPHLPILWYQQ